MGKNKNKKPATSASTEIVQQKQAKVESLSATEYKAKGDKSFCENKFDEATLFYS